MRELYYDLAHDPEKPDMVRLQAATHLLNRIEGLPTAKVVTASADLLSRMSDEELAAEGERLEAQVRTYEAITMTEEEVAAEIAERERKIQDFKNSVLKYSAER